MAPEGVLEGYVVMELITGEEPEERMRDVAVTTRGPVMGRFRELARELGICLAFGLAERIGDDVYNCAVFIDHRGRLRGKYHKMQLAEGYLPPGGTIASAPMPMPLTLLLAAAASSSATTAGIPISPASRCSTGHSTCSFPPSAPAPRAKTAPYWPGRAKTASPLSRPTSASPWSSAKERSSLCRAG